jgi:hypothetical protein
VAIQRQCDDTGIRQHSDKLHRQFHQTCHPNHKLAIPFHRQLSRDSPQFAGQLFQFMRWWAWGGFAFGWESQLEMVHRKCWWSHTVSYKLVIFFFFFFFVSEILIMRRYGQFLNKAIIDGIVRGINFTLTGDDVTIILPHFWQNAGTSHTPLSFLSSFSIFKYHF